MDIEKMLEEAYWDFDGARSGYGMYKHTPKSERDAFKCTLRKFLKEHNTSIAKEIAGLLS